MRPHWRNWMSSFACQRYPPGEFLSFTCLSKRNIEQKNQHWCWTFAKLAKVCFVYWLLMNAGCISMPPILKSRANKGSNLYLHHHRRQRWYQYAVRERSCSPSFGICRGVRLTNYFACGHTAKAFSRIYEKKCSAKDAGCCPEVFVCFRTMHWLMQLSAPSPLPSGAGMNHGQTTTLTGLGMERFLPVPSPLHGHHSSDDQGLITGDMVPGPDRSTSVRRSGHWWSDGRSASPCGVNT